MKTNNIIHILGLGAALLAAAPALSQIRPVGYVGNAHSHNDYTRNNPFTMAYSLGFGSIEVDLFLRDGELYVAHEAKEISSERTFDKLYLQPILQAFKDSEDGYLYPEQGQLQLLIDPKTDGTAILKVLTEKLRPHHDYFDSKNNPKAVKLVISGNKPKAANFADFDEIFFFDGDLGADYTPEQLARIGLFSAPFPAISKWNGLGRLTEPDLNKVTAIVDSVHRIGKKIRFWASPDTRTTWYEWVKLGIDYINTDNPIGVSEFMRNYPQHSYREQLSYAPYQPRYSAKPGATPRNVILLISDGAGLSQLWAAAIANRGLLNVLNMPYTGYLYTGSTDNYHTDSAAGGSALATGVKTRNRYIGVDTLGNPVTNIPDRLAVKGMVSGIVSNDRVTGATPSSFYAHVSERDMSDSIAYDLLDSKLSLVVGGFPAAFAKADSTLLRQLRDKGFDVQEGVDGIENSKSKRVLAFAGDQVSREWDKLSSEQGSINTGYRMIEHAFLPSAKFLDAKSGGNGFFLMVEGAKIDGGGHGNSTPFTVTEYLSFDKLVGQALEYADADGETLVIVTSDHETGGLVVLDGNYETGHVLGSFATTDHTGIPVPLAAYGPGAEHFQGFVDNSEIAKRIYKLLGID
ncbi:alkaline phosphatase [Parapedobacter koreensis]|uniref:Alkaline phosphatase n=1 Tax=Parapedobacter koreensis TaxID=332977 RepID=A0A1H7PXY3_9SPHI|nr:alkaline phosphatase [Parapedobacter koreensis]SEL40125.1 alkaline phosphatase [Parapedobacter koreensis]